MSDTARGSTALGLFRNREFVALSGTAFARSQAYSTILIALALYSNIFPTSGIVEGLFGTAFAFIQLLIVIPLGRAIDTGNSKRFLLAGLLLNVVVFGGFILVDSAVHVILMRIVQGVGASILWITGTTVIGEISPQGARGRWLGSYNQVAAFSSFAGDLFGGYLLYVYDFKLTYIILSGVTLAATVLVYRYLRDNPGGRTNPDEVPVFEAFRSLLDRPMVQSLVVFRLAFSVGKMAVIIFLPIFAHNSFGINSLFIGGILAGGKLAKTIFQGKVGELTDRIGQKHWFVFVGALLYALGTALIPLAAYADEYVSAVSLHGLGYETTLPGAFFVLFLAYGIIGIADSFRLPASMTLFVEEGERFDSVASSMSLRSISWKIGQIVGPVLVGLIKDSVSILAGFWTAAGFIVVAAFVFLAMYNRGTETERPTPTPGD